MERRAFICRITVAAAGMVTFGDAILARLGIVRAPTVLAAQPSAGLDEWLSLDADEFNSPRPTYTLNGWTATWGSGLDGLHWSRDADHRIHQFRNYNLTPGHKVPTYSG